MEIIRKIIEALMPASWLSWMNGYKTVVGAFFAGLMVVLHIVGVAIPPYVMEIAIALLGIGIVHKLQKTQAAADELKKAIEDLKDQILND
jgi:uncharacterized membrane protein